LICFDFCQTPAPSESASAPIRIVDVDSSAEIGRWRWPHNLVCQRYRHGERPLLDAVNAARDALQSGRDAQVWVKERSSAARVFQRTPHQLLGKLGF
jgi:hypothetical protein